MSLAEIAQQNLVVFREGRYLAPSGREVQIGEALSTSIAGTRLFGPSDLEQLRLSTRPLSSRPRISVTDESTGAALRRLVQEEGEPRVAALNFASAKNPGGGFITGAKAQEEDLSRCSGLYPCLLTQRGYYDANRTSSLLYTDHIIHSPDVPFFRDEALQFLEEPFVASLLTAPAPNAREFLRRFPEGREQVRLILRGRAVNVLTVAAALGHRCLVLGAWGCGVFGNEPSEVAEAFAGAIVAVTEAGADLERITFAVLDRRHGRPTLAAFADRFPTA